MNLESTKLDYLSPKTYCEGCKRHESTDCIFIEYNSLVAELKKNNNTTYYGAIEDDTRLVQNTNEETPILSEFEQNDPDENSTKQKRNHNIEIEVLKHEIIRLNKIMKLANLSTDNYSSDGPVQLGFKRLPALFLTLFIELIGGMIITKFFDVIKKYTLIVSFMTPISALSGILIHSYCTLAENTHMML